ncbi:phage tail protein [Paenarthrobacter sp. PH39-S1]|uniref:phage tail protein n=1 Tax=Paenarthrobacter sp. PH39-S1 TaxID=3046204 RepID=UPI0024B8B5A1|nr:phage tail protein [Paenarthrobacter sp. PH39-S1]MDJ0356001.1 phage tail protein [Paenarthrobacter sp. PH39-S1]
MTEDPLLRVLPEVFRVSASSSVPLRALTSVAGEMHRPVLEVLQGIDRVIDPFRAPEELIPYLSRWVDLDWLTLPDRESAAGPALGVPTSRQRDLIANAADLSARRGTLGGLQRFLRLATGVTGFQIEDEPGAFHVRVRVPAAAADQLEIVRRIVRGIKPAHVTDEVLLMDTRGAEADAPVRPSTRPRIGTGTEEKVP